MKTDEAIDLHEVFPGLNCSDGTGYCISGGDPDYIDWERDIAAETMRAAGYTAISFYTIEKDSFGPLIRGVSATDPAGRKVKFYYG